MLQSVEHRGAVGQKLSNPFDDAAFDLSRRNTNAIRGICAAPGDQTTGYVVAISLTALDRMRWHQAIARVIVQQPSEQVGYCSFRFFRAVRATIRQLLLHRIPQVASMMAACSPR